MVVKSSVTSGEEKMSRVGKNPISVPSGTKVEISGNHISIEGPQGRLSRDIHPRIRAELKDNQIWVRRQSDSRMDRSLHGLFRSLIANMITGVTRGYTKELQIQGVGFRAQLKGKELILSLGFSHPVEFAIPEGVEIELPKPTQIIVKGPDKKAVGEISARIRAVFKPEPYKGKGIRYAGEYVHRKAGKAVA